MCTKCLKISVLVMFTALAADALESNSIGVFTDSERSVLYRTLSSGVLTLPVDIAVHNADYAELVITGINYHRTFVCKDGSNFVVFLPDVSETSENVYNLTLSYFKDGKAKAVQTAILGHVNSIGTYSAVTKVIDLYSARWNLSRTIAVLPVPYGAMSISVGETIHKLDGNAGWFGCSFAQTVNPVQLCLETLDGDFDVMVTPSLISGLILSIR